MATYTERSIQGKRIVITGATNGIGKEIARALLRRGALITMVARNEAKALATTAELTNELPGVAGSVDYVLADMANLTSVRHAATQLATKFSHIDVLVNNAGIHSFSPEASVDGYELMTATNHLGPFLLTTLLLAELKAAAPARIVVTASEAHRTSARLRTEDFAKPVTHGLIGSEPIYGRSKLLNILFTEELAHRLDGTGVTVNCFCPGMVASGLVRDSRMLSAAASVVARTPIVRTPEQGARMGIRLVLDDSLDETTGQFFTSTPGLRFLPVVSARRDRDLQRHIFDRTTQLVGLS